MPWAFLLECFALLESLLAFLLEYFALFGNAVGISSGYLKGNKKKAFRIDAGKEE